MAAVVAPTRLIKETNYDLWEWAGIASGGSGSPIWLGNHNDLTFHVFGTFNGETISIQGSLNINTTATTDNGSALEEESGVPISMTTADRWATSRSAPTTCWPLGAGTGDGSTSLTVRVAVRR